MAPLRRRVAAVVLLLACILLIPAHAIDREAPLPAQPPTTTPDTAASAAAGTTTATAPTTTDAGDVAAVDVAGATATAAAATTTTTTWWKPTTALAFNYQLGETFDINRHVIRNVSVYAIDWETPATTVAAMKARGLNPVCYFSAGTFENWRPDKGDFPPAVIGNALGEWPGESWLDVRSAAVRAVMAKRIAVCKDKGFLAIDPDNVDGYTNDPGFPLIAADQLAYNIWLADTAHAAGLAAGLKNALDLIAPGHLAAKFDFAVNEQCYQYNECGSYAPFKAARKPVWNIEYAPTTSVMAFKNRLCKQSAGFGLRSILKTLALKAKPRDACPGQL